jgi:radical SAM superfamily enzyme YgiQ (UPF0313 family)
VKLLLINPKFPESFWSYKWALDNYLPGKRTLNPPLGLATLAALCPTDWDIEIVDENTETVPLQPEADIVGVCGMAVQHARQKELLAFYKHKGYFVVAGGSYASLCPEAFESLADSVVSGEAEYIWPEFCRDYMAGKPQALYHETGTVSLSDSPTPRFDLLDLDKYQAVSLQFSRGCPFRCEFCDIIVMFGRKPRTKSPEQVGRELDELRARNVRSVFFVDDNLIGNRPRAKELLRFIADYQRKHNYTFRLGTEASINLARDKELLALFREANFQWVFIGIESPDEESLKETKKMQNVNQDLLASVHAMHAHKIDVLGGFIIGFDNDTTEVFEKQYQFITKSGIQSAMIGLLTAVPKTPLYERLEAEGRLVAGEHVSDNSKLKTNVIPKGMTYDEMVDGYRALHFRLFSDRGIADRIKNKTRFMAHHFPIQGTIYTPKETVQLSIRFFIRTVMGGGPKRMYHFLRTIPFAKPKLFPMVVSDWVVGLSMKSYMDRHFVQEYREDTRRVMRHVERMKETFRHHRHEGALGVSARESANAAAAVWISMKGRLEPRSFKSITAQVEHLMQNTRSSVTFQIAGFNREQHPQLARLLKRLSRYGDRIHFHMDENSRKVITIDSSVFNLGLQSE